MFINFNEARSLIPRCKLLNGDLVNGTHETAFSIRTHKVFYFSRKLDYFRYNNLLICKGNIITLSDAQNRI